MQDDLGSTLNRLAIRNLFRHRVRSLVTLAAIAFSTIVLIVAAGFIQQIFATSGSRRSKPAWAICR